MTAEHMVSVAGTSVTGAATLLAGELSMTVGVRGGTCIATRQYHRGALRILRPHYLDESGQVCYLMVNPGGGYLGGDVYEIDIIVDAEARLLLTTQSATKVYRTPGSRAEQRMWIRLGPGASLEFLPDQLIAYREASYRQGTVIDMASDASLVMAEVVTPGWSPDGALFRYDEIRLRNEIRVNGNLVVLDNLLIRPGTGSRVDGMAFLEDYTHLGSLLVVDRRVDSTLLDELHTLLSPLNTGGQLGLSLLEGPGFLLRALSHATEPLNALLGTAVDHLRARWFGQRPLNLRKY